MLKRLLVLLPVVLLLTHCSDDPVPPATDRYVYYIIKGQGLHRYSITTGVDELVVQDNVVWITQVAENGTVLFATEGGGGRQLWGRCADGSIVPVPMLVAESSSEEYVLASTPPSLSYMGHHAAFVVYKRPVQSMDSTKWSARLCVFDCAAWKMSMADIASYTNSLLAGSGFTADVLRVFAVHLTDYGDAAALIVHVDDKQPGSDNLSQRSVLLGYDAGGFRLLDSIDVESGALLRNHKFDPKSAIVYAFPPWKSPFAVDCRTNDVRDLVTPYVPYDPFTPLAWQTSEFVFMLLKLCRMDTGAETIVLADVPAAMKWYTDLVQWDAHDWAISPDADQIAMLWSTKDDKQALFIVRRDGSALTRVATGDIVEPIVISNVVPK